MEGIKEVGISICFTVIVSTLFSILMPSQKLEKVIGFSISLFFVTGVISPFFNTNIDFSIDIADIVDVSPLQHEMTSQLTNIAVTRLQNSTLNILTKNNLEVTNVQIYVNNLDYDSISIDRVIITTYEQGTINQAKIQGIVQSELGIIPQIIVLEV